MKELIVFTVGNRLDSSIFNTANVFKEDKVLSAYGGCRTTASIEACGIFLQLASERGSTPRSRPLFSPISNNTPKGLYTSASFTSL